MLGDRIGIMARGKLRALGSSIRLKQKFGTGVGACVRLCVCTCVWPEFVGWWHGGRGCGGNEGRTKPLCFVPCYCSSSHVPSFCTLQQVTRCSSPCWMHTPSAPNTPATPPPPPTLPAAAPTIRRSSSRQVPLPLLLLLQVPHRRQAPPQHLTSSTHPTTYHLQAWECTSLQPL